MRGDFLSPMPRSGILRQATFDEGGVVSLPLSRQGDGIEEGLLLFVLKAEGKIAPWGLAIFGDGLRSAGQRPNGIPA